METRVKGTVSQISLVNFIYVLPDMKVDISKEITSMDLHDTENLRFITKNVFRAL